MTDEGIGLGTDAQVWAEVHNLNDEERLWISEAGCETVGGVVEAVRAQKFLDWFGYPHGGGDHHIRKALEKDLSLNT